MVTKIITPALFLAAVACGNNKQPAGSQPQPTVASTDCTEKNVATWSDQLLAEQDPLLTKLASTPWTDCDPAAKAVTALEPDMKRVEAVGEQIGRALEANDKACRGQFVGTWASDPRGLAIPPKLETTNAAFEDWDARCASQPGHDDARAIARRIMKLMQVYSG